ncbi:MAG: hypothetical protein IIA64_02270 [Planctomycetes bacterium]|nr:hypothetical protein [Planctomycetota bacterium]
MAVKPQATQWIIREQIIEDPVSGLTFQFEVMPKGDARLRVYTLVIRGDPVAP